MKRIAVFIITIAFVLTGLSAFAAKANAISSEKTLFQAVNDSIEKAYNAREKKAWEDPIQKAEPMFEQAKAKIDSLDAKSSAAKNLSLRGNKEEILRRRLIK